MDEIIEGIKICFPIEIPLLLILDRNIRILRDALLDLDNFAEVIFEPSKASIRSEIRPRFPRCMVVCLVLPFDLGLLIIVDHGSEGILT